MVAGGMTGDEVIASYVAKHGEKILIAPDARGFNLFAWLGPLGLLLSGIVGIVLLVRRWGSKAANQTDDETRAEREVALLGPGEIIGEMSMLDGSARSATVRPKDGSIRVLRISGQRFRSRLLPRSRVARPLLVGQHD